MPWKHFVKSESVQLSAQFVAVINIKKNARLILYSKSVAIIFHPSGAMPLSLKI